MSVMETGALSDLFDFDAQCVREAFHGVFRGRIHALRRHDGLGHFATDVDERSTDLLIQWLERDRHGTPFSSHEDATHVPHLRFREPLMSVSR
jgi:hypothetical protein